MTDLEVKALSQFDLLLECGELLWQKNTPRNIEFKPFNFEFRVAPSLKEKPQNEDEGNSKPDSAFSDKHPLFSLGLFGTHKKHKLILNKFCVVRPQFVLHTVEHEDQEDGLNADDFGASWEALQLMGDKYMVIFNGGVDAGASVAHKHLQLIPKGPHIDTMPLTLQRGNGTLRIEGLPYQHSIASLASDVNGDALKATYSKLHSKLDAHSNEPHNIILTGRWLMVIPRRKAWIDEIAANAASMVGMVWCKSEAQYEGWIARGIEEVLVQMGKPWALGSDKKKALQD